MTNWRQKTRELLASPHLPEGPWEATSIPYGKPERSWWVLDASGRIILDCHASGAGGLTKEENVAIAAVTAAAINLLKASLVECEQLDESNQLLSEQLNEWRSSVGRINSEQNQLRNQVTELKTELAAQRERVALLEDATRSANTILAGTRWTAEVGVARDMLLSALRGAREQHTVNCPRYGGLCTALRGTP